MRKLADKICLPIEENDRPLQAAMTQKYLKQLDNKWKVSRNKKISFTFNFKSFNASIKFVKKTANLAEEQDHHPDICIFYNKVQISLSTHVIGGLSENDFIMAAKIERLM